MEKIRMANQKTLDLQDQVSFQFQILAYTGHDYPFHKKV